MTTRAQLARELDRLGGLEDRMGGLERVSAAIGAELGALKGAQQASTAAVESLRATIEARARPNVERMIGAAGVVLIAIAGAWAFYTREQNRTDDRVDLLDLLSRHSTEERARQAQQIVTEGQRITDLEKRVEDGLRRQDEALQREMRDLNKHQDDVLLERGKRMDALADAHLRLEERMREVEVALPRP